MAGAGLPVVLDLTGRTVLVVGGGPVGRRKAVAARSAGAVVRVVDPDPPPPAAAGMGVEWLAEAYHPGHLAGAKLVFAAAPPGVNERVVADATAAGVWVCSASDPPAGDFALPAAVRRGAFVLAVGTGGAAPAFARRVRDRLAAEFDASIGAFVELLADARRDVLATVPDPAARRAVLDHLSGWDWLDRLRRDGVAATRAAMADEVRRAAGG